MTGVTREREVNGCDERHLKGHMSMPRKMVILLFALLPAFTSVARGDAADKKQPSLFELPLEEVMKLRVTSAATLTRTTLRGVPAAVTRITQKDIQSSGARSLDKVLEIFVPNLELMRNYFGPTAMGIRGIIGSDNDKILLLVNGRVMNHRLKAGAFSERDLPTLGDIHHIDVVRGPGSAIYGPGAVAGVVDIITKSHDTFDGFDVTVRQGCVEQFTSLEMRYGRAFTDTSGIFVDYGLTDYKGADQDDSPYIFGKTFNSLGDEYIIESGEPVPFDIVDDHHAYRSKLKHKFHAQYNNGSFEAWLRYTRGGLKADVLRQSLAAPPLGRMPPGFSVDDFGGRGFGYQQFTLYTEYAYDISQVLNFELSLSYDMLDYEEQPVTNNQLYMSMRPKVRYNTSREDECYARVLGHWTPTIGHALSVGLAWSHEIFGLKSPGFPDLPAATQFQGSVDDWSTNTYSFLCEYQWNIDEKWTMFAGGRLDDHTYTQSLFSPRTALIYVPTEKDTIKLVVNQSVRRSSDDELRSQYVDNGTLADVETIQTSELRYERLQTKHMKVSTSAFYEDIELVAWNSALQRSNQLADYDVWGLEAETSYRSDRARITFSHAYTKLLAFNLTDPTTTQSWSAAPYGYGNDLANWSNHITKMYVGYEILPQWNVDGSLQVYWGFGGAEDQTEYNNEQGTLYSSQWLGLSDPGYRKGFRGNYFLNLGVGHQLADGLMFRFDAYNVLGWVDKDYNKQNFTERVSEYRCAAAAFGFMLRYKF